MKNEKNIYKTSQRELLLDFLRSHPDEEFSTEEITGALCGKAIGKSTVYRLISKLCKHDTTECIEHKCKKADCGKIIHLNCDFMAELEGHIAGAHGFRLDPKSTVINGICAECEKKESIE